MSARRYWPYAIIIAALVGILAWIGTGAVQVTAGFDARALPALPEVAVGEIPEPDGTLLLYPDGADPIEVAGQWTTHLLGLGLKKIGDQSRPGRTVSLFRDTDGETVVLAVGATRTGAFAAVVEPEFPDEHWAFHPDTSAPGALHALLPPPKAPEGGSDATTTSIAAPTSP